jgi:hypothetical protein
MVKKTRRLTIGERFKRISEATKKRRVAPKPNNWNQVEELLNKIARDSGVSFNSIREFCGFASNAFLSRSKPTGATVYKLEKSLNIKFKENGGEKDEKMRMWSGV